jgi:hypothetical protein
MEVRNRWKVGTICLLCTGCGKGDTIDAGTYGEIVALEENLECMDCTATLVLDGFQYVN